MCRDFLPVRWGGILHSSLILASSDVEKPALRPLLFCWILSSQRCISSSQAVWIQHLATTEHFQSEKSAPVVTDNQKFEGSHGICPATCQQSWNEVKVGYYEGCVAYGSHMTVSAWHVLFVLSRGHCSTDHFHYWFIVQNYSSIYRTERESTNCDS